jgi:hypothetical protein
VPVDRFDALLADILRFFNGSPGSLVPVVADLLMLRCSIEHSIATSPHAVIRAARVQVRIVLEIGVVASESDWSMETGAWSLHS